MVGAVHFTSVEYESPDDPMTVSVVFASHCQAIATAEFAVCPHNPSRSHRLVSLRSGKAQPRPKGSGRGLCHAILQYPLRHLGPIAL